MTMHSPVGPRGGASPYKNLLNTPLHMYLRSQIRQTMARKRKSWTSLNYTFKLYILPLFYLRKNHIYVMKIYVCVHARKNYATVEINP